MMGKSSDNKNKELRKIIIISAVVIAVFIFFSIVFAAYNAYKTKEHEMLSLEEGVSPNPTPTISEQATPEPSPTLRSAFIPDPDELLPIPQINEINIDDKLVGEMDDTQLNIYWEVVDDADYYVFCAANDDGKIYHKDILWPDISEWLLNDVKNGSVYLFCYKDMGEDSAKDDILITTLAMEIEIETETEQATPQPTDNVSDEILNKYMIIVDKEDFTFAAFTYNGKGEYTILVEAFPTAIGRSDRTTPLGTFEISSKGAWKEWSSGSFSPYYTRFTSGLYFHGSIYSSKSSGSMYRNMYNEIGTASSAGCLRTTYEAAQWVYFNCPAGTIVKIVNSSDLVQKVFRPEVDPAYPTWDPTDPNKPKLDPPAVLVNTVLNVDEGQTGNLQGLLSAYDKFAEPDKLIYEIKTMPANGTISSNKFTQEELDNGTIIYTHDGTDTESDSFQFTVTNLSSSTGTITFNININPIDDAPPVITVNEWLTIDQGESFSLSQSLAVQDEDTPSDDLVFTITTLPEHGTIAQTFTQSELLDGDVVYTHDGSTSEIDSFMFSVTDGINVLSDQMFAININVTQPDTAP